METYKATYPNTPFDKRTSSRLFLCITNNEEKLIDDSCTLIHSNIKII